MRPVHRTLVPLLSAALVVTGGRAGEAQTANIRVSGRVQTQFTAVSGDSTLNFNTSTAVTSGFDVRRLRIQADVRIGENVNLVVQPSFEMGALRMRDAYLRVLLARTATSGLGLTIGQEKRPFNRLELTSSNNLLSIERGARLRGFTGAVAQNNLLEENGYIAHDIGASLDAWALENRVAVKVGFANGSGESAQDVNNAKAFGVRATATVIRDAEQLPVLRVGAAMMAKDRAVCLTAAAACAAGGYAPDSSYRSTAFALDAEWGDFRPGLHVIFDFATGDHLPAAYTSATGRNTGNFRPNIGDSAIATFRSLHAVGGWRWQLADPAGTRLIKTLEPALRVDLTDPDTDASNDAGTLITPVLNVYFSQTTLMRAGVDFYRYRDAAGAAQSVRAFRVSWQANF